MNRGEVVLVDWPYTDLTGSKLRPALVVQADFLNGLVDDTIYVKVQSAKHLRILEVSVDGNVTEFQTLK